MARILGADILLVNKAEGARPEFPVPAMTEFLENTFRDYSFEYGNYANADDRDRYMEFHISQEDREEFMGICSDAVINHMIRVARMIVDAGHSGRL